jgi:hypothetical protein
MRNRTFRPRFDPVFPIRDRPGTPNLPKHPCTPANANLREPARTYAGPLARPAVFGLLACQFLGWSPTHYASRVSHCRAPACEWPPTSSWASHPPVLIRVGRPQSLACSPASSWVGRPLSEDQGASSHSEVQQDYEVSPCSSASGGENQENI